MSTVPDSGSLLERQRALVNDLSARRERLRGAVTPQERKALEQPVRTMAATAAQAWWEKQPMHEGVHHLEAQARQVMQPMANQHPYRLLALSALAGALGAAWLPARLRALAVPYLVSHLSSHVGGLARHVGQSLFRGPR